MDEQKHDEEHGEFRVLAELLSRFLTNEAPHMQRALGKLEGRITMLVVGLGLLSTLTVAVLVRLLVA